MSAGKFNGKVVLITGAASGFGKLLAERLATDFAKLILADRNEAGLAEVTKRLRDMGTQVLAKICDVTSEAQVKELVEQGVKHFGLIDIAVNNAGMSTAMKPLIETEESEFDLNFSVNTKSVFFGLKYQIPAMIAQGGGCILNVASLAGLGAAPKLAAYGAAKHAVVGLTRTAAVEYAKHNIRVNAICPFYSPTPLMDEFDIDHEMLAQGSPMKRLGKPEEIVAAMLAMISPDNSYMNGQAIAVDGGISAF
jgi:NAD(P)-dependent dehydrogenase (short-subunit alcohol dehydrogenase family)